MLVGSPTLTGEILADLKKARPANKIPEEMVQSLARKVGRTCLIQPTSFRKLALRNLDCVRVPMKEQVPIDGDAPNVEVVEGGNGVLYDLTQEQEIWRRWADGDFIIQDHDTVMMWHRGIERLNLRAIGDSWKEYVNKHFGATRTIPELVDAIDQHLATSRIDRQRYLFMTLLDFLRAPNGSRCRTDCRFGNVHTCSLCTLNILRRLAPWSRLPLTECLSDEPNLLLCELFLIPLKATWVTNE